MTGRRGVEQCAEEVEQYAEKVEQCAEEVEQYAEAPAGKLLFFRGLDPARAADYPDYPDYPRGVRESGRGPGLGLRPAQPASLTAHHAAPVLTRFRNTAGPA